jgi:hypothetical protein
MDGGQPLFLVTLFKPSDSAESALHKRHLEQIAFDRAGSFARTTR